MGNIIFVLVTLLLISPIAAISKVKTEGMSSLQDIEIIEVLGSKPLTLLLTELKQTRYEFMDTFNTHIKDEDLKFECKTETIRGSHLKKEVCKNVFSRRIYYELLRKELELTSDNNLAQAYAAMGNAEQEQRQEDLIITIQEMLGDNAQFSQTYIDFKKAELAYKKAHKEKFGIFSGFKLDSEDRQ